MNYEQQIAAAVQRWAAGHPDPDNEVLVTAMGVFSPRQIAKQVRLQTPVGLFVVEMIEYGSGDKSIEEVLTALAGCEDELAFSL